MQFEFIFNMYDEIYYKIKHEIVNCEQNWQRDVTWSLPPPLSQTVTLSQTPSPFERDILNGRPHLELCWYLAYLLRYMLPITISGLCPPFRFRSEQSLHLYTSARSYQDILLFGENQFLSVPEIVGVGFRSEYWFWRVLNKYLSPIVYRKTIHFPMMISDF